MTPINVDADTKVKLMNSCNCRCWSNCCCFPSPFKKKHDKTCELAKKKFDEIDKEAKK